MKRALWIFLTATLLLPASLALLPAAPDAGAQDGGATEAKLEELIRSLRSALAEKGRKATRSPLTFEVHIYDVRDLTHHIPDFPAEASELVPSGGFGFGFSEGDDIEPMPYYEIDALADLIRESVAPASWDELSRVSVMAMENGLIMVRHTAAVHDRIAALFEELREKSVSQVTLDVMVLSISDSALREVLGSAGGSALDAASEKRLDDALKSGTAKVLRRSSLTCTNTQRVGLSDFNQVTYMQDYDVEIAQGSCTADPIIQTLKDGLTMDVRPVVAGNGDLVVMEVRVTETLLQGPIESLDTPLGAIETPVLDMLKVRTTVAAPLGGTAVVGGTLSAGSGEGRLVVIRPTAIRPTPQRMKRR